MTGLTVGFTHSEGNSVVVDQLNTCGRQLVCGLIAGGFALGFNVSDVFFLIEMADSDLIVYDVDLSIVDVAVFPEGFQVPAVKGIENHGEARLALPRACAVGEEAKVLPGNLRQQLKGHIDAGNKTSDGRQMALAPVIDKVGQGVLTIEI